MGFPFSPTRHPLPFFLVFPSANALYTLAHPTRLPAFMFLALRFLGQICSHFCSTIVRNCVNAIHGIIHHHHHLIINDNNSYGLIPPCGDTCEEEQIIPLAVKWQKHVVTV